MQPNVIIVMADQLRADLRRSCGYALDTMPFLDEWAAGGVDFSLACTPQPTCMPARVSMLTGRYASAHRVRTNHNAEDAFYETGMLEFLKEQGYRTALCGKNHSHYPESAFDFAETCGHLGHEGNMQLSANDELLADFLDGTNHMEAHRPSPGGITAQHPYHNVSSALKFLDSQPAEKPFFLWVSFAEPHNPYQVPEPYYNMFPPEDLPPLKTVPEDISRMSEKFRWTQNVWNNIMGDDRDSRIARARSNYHGMLRLIDDQFRRLMEGLADRGLTENTVVVFLADHGDFAGDYGMMRKGPELPEVLCRIPMVWRGPGIVPQKPDENHFVSLIDVFPTICRMLGKDIPFGVQGKSLLPLLRQRDIPKDEFDCAYAESGFGGLYWTDEDSLMLWQEGACDKPEPGKPYSRFDCLNTWTQCGQVRMLRKGSFKIQMDMLENGRLYDLSKDPMELDNLYGRPEYAAVQNEMLAALMAASLRACDPLPPPHRRYSVKVHPDGYWFQPYRK